MSLLHEGGKDQLIIREGKTGGPEHLSIQATTGAMSVRGDLTIGGSAVGPRAGTVKCGIGSRWMPATRLDENRRAKSPGGMGGTGKFKVCFATKESGGNHADDFVALAGMWMQTHIRFGAGPNPTRVAEGSGPHSVLVEGLGSGDGLRLQKASCTATGSVAAGGTSTSTVSVPRGHSSVSILLEPSLVAGSYKVCHSPHSSGGATGSFSGIPALAVMVVPSPLYSPHGGSAGKATTVIFQGAMQGDFVSLQPSDCSKANSTTSSSDTLGKLTLETNLAASTSSNMTDGGLLRTCYATKESMGDSPGDFVQIGTGFRQTKFSFTV